MFGVTPEEVARANRMHIDDELQVDEVLKVPHPFTTEVTNLKVADRDAERAAAGGGAEVRLGAGAGQDAPDAGAGTDQPESGFGQLGVKLLPWWRATAISLAIFALIMFGVMLLTMFEWWRMRRRFMALAAMTDALSRLDYKYKAMFAKAELRLQQLYGRRRGAVTEGQPRPRMPEEVEIERLNEELKNILETHLQRMGAKLPGAAPQGMARTIWRRRRRLDGRSTRYTDANWNSGRYFIMRKFALMAILATVMVTPFAMSWASGTRASDTPECCVKKQGCCPSASCCSGGSHSMGAHCMMHTASH